MIPHRGQRSPGRSGDDRRPIAGTAGLTVLELVVALALASLVMALVGSLFVASLSVWRRGAQLREAHAHAGGLTDVMARDIRNASQAPSVLVRPPLDVPDGEPILAVTAGVGPAADQGPAWVVYVHDAQRREVRRLVVVVDPAGAPQTRESRLMATGVERVTVTGADGGGVTVEVAVRRGKDLATSRTTAAPRNP